MCTCEGGVISQTHQEQNVGCARCDYLENDSMKEWHVSLVVWMKTHYVTIKEYLAYMSGICQDPILDFPVDVLPEEGVESQPVDEEQEEKWL